MPNSQANTWPSLVRRLNGPPEQQAAAAIELVIRALGGSNGRGHFRFGVQALKNGATEICFLREDGTVAANTCIGLDEVRANATTADDLVLHIFSCAFPGATLPKCRDDVEASALPRRDDLRARVDDAVHTERANLVIRRLTDGNDCRLIGQSSSGKTTTALQVALQLLTLGWSVCWLDLSQPDRGVGDLIRFFASSPAPTRGQTLLVLDDCQSNPSEATKIISVVHELAAVLASKLQTLVVAWESSATFVESILPQSVAIPCSGSDVIPEIAHEFMGADGISDNNLDNIIASSSGDVLLARLQLDILKSSGRLPAVNSLSEVALQRARGDHELTPREVRLLYRVAAMSQFEIDTSIDYFADTDAQDIDLLISLRLVRRTGHYLSVGHRSMAKLLLRSLAEHYSGLLEGLPRPAQIAVEYVRGAPPQQLVTTLERLDLARLTQGNTKRGEQHGTAFLARAWQSFLTIVDTVARHTAANPTWSDNTASACFAGEALAEVANPGWRSLAAYLRERWFAPVVPGLVEHTSAAPSERIDFEEIRIAMRIEDDDCRASGTATTKEAADAIDLDRMHRTWVLGLLLGFEASAPEPDAHRLRHFKECAETIQELSGAFYPERVPWVTARVLLGLAAAGESERTSRTVKRACDWLRQSSPCGPYSLGTWESGTGTWNTVLGTTAMCTSALLECGIPTSDPCVKTATEYLFSRKADWNRAGHEIDGAFAMATVLAARGRWRDLSSELETFIAWLNTNEFWASATKRADEMHEESCKVAQIAGALISMVWTVVRRELPLLLEDLSLDFAPSPSESSRRHFDKRDILRSLAWINESLVDAIKAGEHSVEDLSDVPQEVVDQLDRRRRLRAEVDEMTERVSQPKLVSEGELEQLVTRINRIGQELFQKTWAQIQPLGVLNA